MSADTLLRPLCVSADTDLLPPGVSIDTLSRKVAEAPNGGTIEIWGKGDQTRSFLYIDECIEGIRRLMNSDVTTVLNIGSDEMITINDLAKMVIEISGKNLSIKNVPGPEGVRGRNPDNNLIKQKLNWAPSQALRIGMNKTFAWVKNQVETSSAPALAYTH